MSDYSSDGLLQFLRDAAIAGRMNPAMARSRRNAAEHLFRYLTEAESTDLRQADIGVLAARCREQDGAGLRLEVVELYAQRLRAALEDYLRFRESPDDFRADTHAAGRSRASAAPAMPSAEQRALESVRLRATAYRPDVLPVPLAAGRTVYLHGLPADLTTAEARKISRVLMALADEGEGKAIADGGEEQGTAP